MTAGFHATDRAVLRVSGPGRARLPAGPRHQRRAPARRGAGLCRAPLAAGQVPLRLLPGARRRGRADRRQGRPRRGAGAAARHVPAARQGRDRADRPRRGRRASARRRRARFADPRHPDLGWRAYVADPAALLAGMAPLAPEAMQARRIALGVPETGRRAPARRQLHPGDGLRAAERRRLPQGLLRRPGGHRADEAQDRAPQGPGPGARGGRGAAARHRDPRRRARPAGTLYSVAGRRGARLPALRPRRRASSTAGEARIAPLADASGRAERPCAERLEDVGVGGDDARGRRRGRRRPRWCRRSRRPRAPAGCPPPCPRASARAPSSRRSARPRRRRGRAPPSRSGGCRRSAASAPRSRAAPAAARRLPPKGMPVAKIISIMSRRPETRSRRSLSQAPAPFSATNISSLTGS